MLSPAALESKWCELEINAAINLSLEQGRQGRLRIIPLVISPCELPVLLRGRLYINFHQRYDETLRQWLAEFGGSDSTTCTIAPNPRHPHRRIAPTFPAIPARTRARTR